jgi:hypothetical protein
MEDEPQRSLEVAAGGGDQQVTVDGRRWTLQTALWLILRRRQKRREKEANKRPRSCWTRPWLMRRAELGVYNQLMVELANEDVPGYVAFQRLAPNLFQELLEKVMPLISKQHTNMRAPISPGERLAITLRYLATGM